MCERTYHAGDGIARDAPGAQRGVDAVRGLLDTSGVRWSSFVVSRLLPRAVAASAWFAAGALAQVDPTIGHGYVEPCTVANVQQANTECATCSADDFEAGNCAERLGALGYEFECRTGAHSPPAEVWCRELDSGKPSIRVIGVVVLALVLILAGAFLRARQKRLG